MSRFVMIGGVMMKKTRGKIDAALSPAALDYRAVRHLPDPSTKLYAGIAAGCGSFTSCRAKSPPSRHATAMDLLAP